MAPLVLVVDDDADYSLLLTIYLEQGGYRVSTARSAAEAMSSALRERPDLVTVDYRMAEVDGLELCRRLRAEEPTRDLPLMLITGNPQPELEAWARAAGVDAFFYKLDLTAPSFLAAVAAALRP
jgi:CheY-like chemotaxis protein